MEQIPPVIHSSWHPYLQPLFDDRKMHLLKYDILPKTTPRFFPEKQDVFKVFSMPLDKIKVVIIGQDPYANPNEAIGLAFAVKYGIKMPASLKVIKDEIISSKVERDTSVNIDSGSWQELKHWHQQGVFLLNSALTVEFKNPSSHLMYWSWFTREVVKTISEQKDVVWMLWGAKSQVFSSEIHKGIQINREDDLPKVNGFNVILKAPHPAAQFYNSNLNPKFSGCNHFALANKILKIKKRTIINW